MTKVATYLRHNLDTLLLQQVIKLPRRIVEASMVAAESENRSKFRRATHRQTSTAHASAARD